MFIKILLDGNVVNCVGLNTNANWTFLHVSYKLKSTVSILQSDDISEVGLYEVVLRTVVVLNVVLVLVLVH